MKLFVLKDFLKIQSKRLYRNRPSVYYDGINLVSRAKD